MAVVVEWIKRFALSAGGPGLFVVAFLDSSLLSLPEINDLLIIWMVSRHKHRLVYYASMATLGSVAGCLFFYYVGRRGGEAVLARFKDEHVARSLVVFRRYGVFAVLVPSLLPPPAPFKIFVLLAGVSRMALPRFSAAVATGRSLRYFGEGWLALRYGDRALEYLYANSSSLWIGAVVVAGIGGIGYYVTRRLRRGPRRDENG